MEANGARWPSRSSKSVRPALSRPAEFDSQALPPATANHARLHAPNPSAYATSFGSSVVTSRIVLRRCHQRAGSVSS